MLEVWCARGVRGARAWAVSGVTVSDSYFLLRSCFHSLYCKVYRSCGSWYTYLIWGRVRCVYSERAVTVP